LIFLEKYGMLWVSVVSIPLSDRHGTILPYQKARIAAL